jgi:hypothetical protein
MNAIAQNVCKVSFVGFLAFALLPGCVKRTETITVNKDGSVKLEVKVEGDRADMESGAPPLGRAHGWEFDEKIEKQDDDKENIIRTVRTTIPPGRPIPAAYPTNDPEGEALALQHPTTVTIERRADGTYYHFRRVFEARPWAYLNYYHQVLIEEPLERSGDKSPDELSPEKKQELVQNIIHLEGMKHLTHARRAALAIDPPMRQDHWVRIHAAVKEALDEVDTELVLELLEQSWSEEDSDDAVAGELTKLADQLNERITDAVRKTLLHLGMSKRYVAAFGDAIAEEKRRFAITEDYGDEKWDVYLSMPGRLIGHNGDSIDEGKIKWSIDGKGFYDREVELLATSVVPNE